jgi:HEAT repeat protein
MIADLLLRWIWCGSLSLALLSVLSMLMLIVRRLVLRRGERRHAQRRSALLQRIVRYLDGTDDKAALEAAAAGQLEVVAELIAELRQVVRGDNRERLTELAASLGVINFNRRRLIEGDVRARRLAAAWLAIGPAQRVAVALEAALEDRDYQVRLAAARSLAELRAVGSVRVLVEKLGIEAEHNSRVLYFVFRQLVPALSDQLVALLDSDQPVVIKELALDALAKTGDGRLVEPIARLVDDPSPDIRADALRALAELGYPEAGPCALEALSDPSWPVRMQAAACIGRIGFLAAIPKLADLLGDAQWWVRYRAAEALYELGEKGWEVLRSAAAETAGPRARVSELLLAEKEQAA